MGFSDLLAQEFIPFFKSQTGDHLTGCGEVFRDQLFLVRSTFWAGAQEAIVLKAITPAGSRARLVFPGELAMHTLTAFPLD